MNCSVILQEKQKRIWKWAVLFLLLCLQLTVLIYYGNRKAGFHEDEFYSYYTTNKTAGLFVEDRTWQERDDFRNDFVVLENERFRYNIVKQMQSWDVHPPFYYYLLHTVCSFFPGVFSKWLGISVNMAAFIPCFFLLFSIVKNIVEDEKNKDKAEDLAFLVCLFWGFSAAVVSGVMFIRMYQWLTLFLLFLTWLHVKAWKRDKFGVWFYLPLLVTVFLGFMTQYYYIIFHIFLGAGFCLLLLRNKKIKELFCYGFSCAVGLLLAIVYYPACLSHIFRGYRGTEAVSEFTDTENTLGRLRFFVGLFDDYVLNGCLAIVILLICMGWLTIVYLKKRGSIVSAGKEGAGKRAQMINLLLFTCVGYFFTISKTALLLGETSNRYQLPIYGLLLFLLLYFVWKPVELLIERIGEKKQGFRVLGAVMLVGILGILISSHAGNRVFFLYEEEAEIMEYVEQSKDVPVVVYYRDDSELNVWRLSDELMVYPRIYLANQNNKEPITDETITGSDKLLVYVADKEDKETCLENLLHSNSRISSYREIARKSLWTLYELE